jgi:hypothetical protein
MQICVQRQFWAARTADDAAKSRGDATGTFCAGGSGRPGAVVVADAERGQASEVLSGAQQGEVLPDT